MKIAILTFFESENYGTVLQAYATQKYLETLGHTAELIHLKREVNGHSSHYVRVCKKVTFFEKVQYKIVSYLRKKDIQGKSKKFVDFREKYLRVSRYYESAEELKKDLGEYDLFVSGGDQIWNPYHKVFSLHYMFDFLPEGQPRVAYGSSFGVSSIQDGLILSQMNEELKKYNAIGVREESGIEIIRKMGLDAVQVVDPVFLIRERWRNFVTERPRKKKYCLVYALIGYPQTENHEIVEFAKKRKLEIVILPFNRQNCLNGFDKQFGLSPQEFLNYISHAEYVFTNSFHGLAFSILFKKQFTLLGCDSEEGIAKRERLVDLLAQFEIGERSFATIGNDINYDAVDELLQVRVDKSKQYMQNALREKE